MYDCAKIAAGWVVFFLLIAGVFMEAGFMTATMILFLSLKDRF